MSFLHPV